jgi:hypothetical protein
VSAKGKRRSAQKAARKQRRAMVAGGKSKYAQKHQQQARGKFRPTSPFYLTPGEKLAVLEGRAPGLGYVR